MKEINLTSNAVIIVCEDSEGTYTWVARNPDEGKKFIRENLSDTYGIKKPSYDDVEVYLDGDWYFFGYGSVKYKMDYINLVEVSQ